MHTLLEGTADQDICVTSDTAAGQLAYDGLCMLRKTMHEPVLACHAELDALNAALQATARAKASCRARAPASVTVDASGKFAPDKVAQLNSEMDECYAKLAKVDELSCQVPNSPTASASPSQFQPSVAEPQPSPSQQCRVYPCSQARLLWPGRRRGTEASECSAREPAG